jgi:hypothetical protein
MSLWKQGDTSPPMVIDCFNGNGQRAPLDEADLVKVVVSQRGNLIWERTVTGTADGVVTVPLQSGDTDTPGTFYVKAYAEWPDGTRQHYPPGDEYMTMTVTR